MLVHVPSEPESLHDWHVPPHDELQQYPSTQLPVEHWFVAEQVLPFAFFAVQTPLAQ